MTSLVTRPVAWVPDKERQSCCGCGAPFSFFRRRSHCRACGEIFCNGCVKKRNSSGCKVCEKCARGVEVLVFRSGDVETSSTEMQDCVRKGDVVSLKKLIDGCRCHPASLLSSLNADGDNLVAVAINCHQPAMAAEVARLWRLHSLDAMLLHTNATSGESLLHIASKNHCIQSVRFLLDDSTVCSQLCNRRCRLGRTPAMTLCASGAGVGYDMLTVLQHLVASDCDLSLVDDAGASVLHLAAGSGALHAVVWLIEHANADVNGQDAFGATPLHYACRAGHAVVVAKLYKYCAVDMCDKMGLHPIHALCSAPPLEFVLGRVCFEETIKTIFSFGGNCASPHPQNGLCPSEMLPVTLRKTAMSVVISAKLIVRAMAESNIKSAIERAVGYGLCEDRVSSVADFFYSSHSDGVNMHAGAPLKRFLATLPSKAKLLCLDSWKRWIPHFDASRTALVLVFMHLEPEDLFRASCVSRSWREATLSPLLTPVRRSIQSVQRKTNVLRHRVAPTDTLAGLAIKYRTTPYEIIKANQIPDSHVMAVHLVYEELMIPSNVFVSAPVRQKTPEEMATEWLKAQQKENQKKVKKLNKRFPQLPDDEIVAYLELEEWDMDRVVKLIEASGGSLTTSMEIDTLTALQALEAQ